MDDNLHGIHARVELFRDAVEQAERAPEQQQIGGNGADALPNLHSGIDRIDVFPVLARLVFFSLPVLAVLLAQDLLVQLANAGLLEEVHKANIWHRPF